MTGHAETLAALLAAEAGSARLADALARVDDWAALADAATAHGVDRLLLRRREAELPEATVAELRRRAFVGAAHQRPLRGQILEVLVALEAAGIPAVPIKGPFLAERLYGDPGLRPSSDGDVLVARADLDRAVDALASVGYRLATGPTERYNRVHSHHVYVLHPERPFIVELHFRAFAGFGTALPAEPLLERARVTQTASGDAVRLLAPEDELVYLMVHAAGNVSVQLKWLYDLHAFVARERDLDWSAVDARVRELRFRRAVGLCLDDLRRLFGDELPIPSARPPRGIRARVVDGLRDVGASTGAFAPKKTLARNVVSGLLCDSAAATARYYAHHGWRLVRRRLSRSAPALVPREWSG